VNVKEGLISPIAHSPIAHTPTTGRAGLSDTCVRDLMTPNPTSIGHGITVREAVALLEGRGIGAALVVNEDGRAVGVLSRSDALRAVLAGTDEAPVRDVMSPAVIAVRPDADARQAAVLMVRCGVQRVFVMEEDGVPVGVVSTTDLLRALKVLWNNHAEAF
jgi:CBS domain-containing protein